MTSIRDFVVGGSCDFCGAVVGNPHESACPTINKEKMTAEKDRIDEAKKILKEHLENETTRKYFKNAVVPNDLLEWLIQEIEKLQRLVDTYDILEIDSLLRQIDSLTKENAELRQRILMIPLEHPNNEAKLRLEIRDLTRERDALQKEVDGDNEDLERMFALKASKVIELEAQLAKSQKRVKELRGCDEHDFKPSGTPKIYCCSKCGVIK